jgi:hypothetical protein
LLHGTFVGSVIFTGLMAYLLLSRGSPRPDAETQNLYFFALAISFGCGAVYIGSIAYGRTIAWKGNQLRVRTSHDAKRSGSSPMCDIAAFKERQGGAAASTASLCQGDALQMYDALHTQGSTALLEATRKLVARPGVPAWGDCV